MRTTAFPSPVFQIPTIGLGSSTGKAIAVVPKRTVKVVSKVKADFLKAINVDFIE
jgi:hypothetical protein